MRSTTIIAPLTSTRRLIHRAHPLANAFRGIGIGAALLVFGLVFLLLSPLAWCVRKISALR